MAKAPVGYPSEFVRHSIEKDGWPVPSPCIEVRRGLIENIGVPATEADIEACERELGCTLPREYRRWLLWCNGGNPKFGRSWTFFREVHPDGLKPGEIVEVLYGVTAGNNGFDLVTSYAMRHKDFPEDCIPIGLTDWADYYSHSHCLALSVRGEHVGQVFEWCVVTPPKPKVKKGQSAVPPPPPQPPRRQLIGRTFQEFWDNLTEDSGGPVIEIDLDELLREEPKGGKK